MRSQKSTFLAFVVFSSVVSAQTGVTLVDAGYSDPTFVNMAPGQVTTLFVTGATTIFPPEATIQRANQVPWPMTLAGFSASIAQHPGNTEALPIYSVEQTNNCWEVTTPLPECIVTAISVQVPYDVIPPEEIASFGRFTTIAISEGGTPSKSFNVNLLPQNFHVLRTCDTTMANRVAAIFPIACSDVVAHADGSLVTASSPAKIGEEVVMYAFGLGPTSPAIPAGQPAPVPAPTVIGNDFGITFAYSGEGVPSLQERPIQASNPLFVGLTPGQVGLYQVNFIVEPPAATPTDCSGPDQANLSVQLFTSASIATARICVDAGSTPMVVPSDSTHGRLGIHGKNAR